MSADVRAGAETLPAPGKAAPGPRPAFPLLLLGVALLALAVRLVPVLQAGALRGMMGYDDGVHYSSGVHLLAGDLPYRDFVLVHPPGIAIFNVPFALLGQLAGDSWGIAASRLAVLGIGAANAVLVAALLRRRGLLAAAAGGALYACWNGTVVAERVMMLEPFLNLGLLLALLALGRASRGRTAVGRAVTLAGIALGLAFTFKIWLILTIVVVGLLVLSRHGLRPFLRYALSAFVAWLAVMGTFLVAAPLALWQQVVLAQAHRPSLGYDLQKKLGYFLDPAWPAALTFVVAGLLAVVVLVPLARELILLSRPRHWPDTFWWAVLAGCSAAFILIAPSIYDHYATFVAPPLCLLLGAGAGRLSGRRADDVAPARPARFVPARTAAGAVLVAALAVLLVSQSTRLAGYIVPVDSVALQQFAATQECIWTPKQEYLALADDLGDEVRAGCPNPVDRVGSELTNHAGYPTPELLRSGIVGPSDDALWEKTLRDIGDSDAILLRNNEVGSYLGNRTTGAYIKANFTREDIGAEGFTAWVRDPG